jgi:hypothetical protein
MEHVVAMSLSANFVVIFRLSSGIQSWSMWSPRACQQILLSFSGCTVASSHWACHKVVQWHHVMEHVVATCSSADLVFILQAVLWHQVMEHVVAMCLSADFLFFLQAVQWHPTMQHVVAMSCIDNLRLK